MSARLLNLLAHIVTITGVTLLLVGGAMWWRQSQLEAALLSQEERVLYAVTLDDQPETLPLFQGLPELTPTPSIEATSTPQPTPGPGETPHPEPMEIAPEPAPPQEEMSALPPASTFPTRVIAPSIDMDVEVVEMGWEVRTARNGGTYSEWIVPAYAAGWHKNSALPGHGGNTVLSGHHNIEGEVFRYVVDLEPGDTVSLEVDGVTYGYRVEEKYIVLERDQPMEVRIENNRYIEPTEDERLTLVTCWPYELNTHRVIVVARPIQEQGS